MEPLRWSLVGLAWGYAIVWMLLLDQVKMWTYAILERRSSPRTGSADGAQLEARAR